MAAVVTHLFTQEFFPVEILDGIEGNDAPGFGRTQDLGKEPDFIANRIYRADAGLRYARPSGSECLGGALHTDDHVGREVVELVAAERAQQGFHVTAPALERRGARLFTGPTGGFFPGEPLLLPIGPT